MLENFKDCNVLAQVKFLHLASLANIFNVTPVHDLGESFLLPASPLQLRQVYPRLNRLATTNEQIFVLISP
jgi:hypothetical protein